MTTTITYGESAIATLLEGGNATLKCAGKIMKANIIVSFATAGIVTYNGITTSAEADGTVILYCANKVMKTDVIIAASVEQLPAPIISLDGDTLTITDNSGLATSFDIFVDGALATNVAVESEEEGGDTEETTYTLSGTWLFNSTIQVDESANNRYSLYFYSNEIGFVEIVLYNSQLWYMPTTESMSDRVVAYQNNAWTSETYRTITFDGEQTVSEEFYTWFTANATKQYTLSGTWVINETPNVDVANDITQNLMDYDVKSYAYAYPDDSWEDMEWLLARLRSISISNISKLSIVFDDGDLGNLASTTYFNSQWSADDCLEADVTLTSTSRKLIRTIYFGDSPVVVSQEFYEWFTLNAVQQFNITYELTNCDLVSGDTTISSGGTATFTVNGPEDYIGYGWTVIVTGADRSITVEDVGSPYSFTISNPVSDVVVQVTVEEYSSPIPV